ncbi:MAG: 2-oxoglutarate ferredoxin oxidoreductase subunit alpha [Elusimicrobia bacterium GWF2_52_66]|nr:MAG: 2-oxoglutarate ferredoxin oxidoreductase subunit alpha [Elusimicrobia bacterium GWA2_51_34]OGR87018.1 MAG: 2-oxoglutarate ferredoxin oxidoreductase subunit alpha [Elusimicrobia bacterium GWF2_52_66]HCE98608.1 2-oxoglutarate ferredoxin oxidoreductase subunit alpha [Elusimicrobiota bacterium]
MNKSSPKKEVRINELNSITIRFAGDSGDGIQLVGHQFANATAIAGNDLSTLPDYPSEVRAPAGSLGGVSGFQLSFGDKSVMTPGTRPDVLIAMNPAALAVNIKNIDKGSVIIVNSDAFNPGALEKAGYSANPLEDGTLANYRVMAIPVNTFTENTLKDSGLAKPQILKCKNFYMLGIMYWMYGLPLEPTINWIKIKFKKTPELAKANQEVLSAGYAYSEAAEIFDARFQIKKSPVAPGKYRNLTGNEAAAYALITAAKLLKKKLFYGSYPITPASEILHTLCMHKANDVVVFQTEDEIAAICTSIGAAFAGCLAATGTSGPGLSLKIEAMGLGVIVELPLVIVNVQRSGPSTGLPTKTEQSDLLQAVYGRHGESPLVVIAAASPADCFTTTLEAARIAVKYMTPVIVLSNAYLSNGSEPFRIPKLRELPRFEVPPLPEPGQFKPYMRSSETLARPWAYAGLKGYEHRIGGLEKADITGAVSYEPENHEKMTKLRAEKIARVVAEIPPTRISGANEGELLVVGWGSTFGAITQAVTEAREMGLRVSSAHIKYMNPLPPDLGTVIRRFRKVLVPEENLGQFRMMLRASYLIEPIGLNKIQGQALNSDEILSKIKEILRGN